MMNIYYDTWLRESIDGLYVHIDVRFGAELKKKNTLSPSAHKWRCSNVYLQRSYLLSSK